MNKLALLLLLTITSGCVSLPDGDTTTDKHYAVLPASGSCQHDSPGTLSIGISRVAAGLDSNRVASISASSGELVYIKDMRWATDTHTLLEQRLAADLENAGFSVITGHHKLSSTPELNCEIRQFNLVKNNGYSAQVALSCVLYDPKQKGYQALQAAASTSLSQLSGDTVAHAISASYSEAFNQLCREFEPVPAM
jgi:ABC-type uncharacterized transport system auxiliary subunit